MTRRGEFQQIADLFAPLAASAPGALGLKDDAALLTPPPGHHAVVTVDAIVSGVHYLPDDPPDLIARKLVRVNLSDLAAMGAQPAGLFLACAFPRDCSDAWVEAFAAGLADDVAAFGCPVLGGDTVATPGPATFSLTAIGWVPSGQALLRSGARPGDLIAVTGSIGDGAAGLWAAQGRLAEQGCPPEACAALTDRYHLPQPRLEAGVALRGIATAAMDISDGLVQDLGHICRASGVCAEIQSVDVPLSPALRLAMERGGFPLELVLSGGDDYELLLTIPPERWPEAQAAMAGAPLTVIGRCLPISQGSEPARVFLRDHHGESIELPRMGWQHF